MCFVTPSGHRARSEILTAMTPRFYRCLSIALVGLRVSEPASAQDAPSPLAVAAESPRRWTGHVTVLAGNATIGALTAGVVRKLRGGSFKDGLLRGALGGAVGYAGKRVAGRTFWGAGFLGREINAVGVSMVRNASDGEPALGRLFLPLGPVPLRARLETRNGVRLQTQLDLVAAGRLMGGLFESGLSLNLSQSLSSGAPIFEADGRWLVEAEHGVRGYAIARSVFLGDPERYPGVSASQADVLAHERVHVLQQDFVLTAWGDPFAGLALDRFGAGRWFSRYTAVDALGWVVGAVSHLTYGQDQQERFPAELEARFLTGH